MAALFWLGLRVAWTGDWNLRAQYLLLTGGEWPNERDTWPSWFKPYRVTYQAIGPDGAVLESRTYFKTHAPGVG